MTTEERTWVIDLCDSLTTDLLRFLKDEGRYKYRMIGYMDEIMASLVSEGGDIEACERFIYQMSKGVQRDYLRLRIKKLSPADSVICIIHKFLEALEDPPEILRDMFQKFHDNIRNRGKHDKLGRIEASLKEATGEERKTGKLRLPDIDLYSTEHPIPKTHELEGSRHEWGDTKGKEIEL